MLYPFTLDMTQPTLEVDLAGYVPGDAMEFIGTVTLAAGETARQVQLLSKVKPTDQDNDPNTVVVTITDVPSSGGAFVQNGVSLNIDLTVKPSASVAFIQPRFVALRVWVQRGARVYPHTVFAGKMVPNAFMTATDPSLVPNIGTPATVTLSSPTGSNNVFLDPPLALIAAAKEADGTPIEGAAFSFTTSDPTIATVDSHGTVFPTQWGFGNVTITATCRGVSGQLVLTVLGSWLQLVADLSAANPAAQVIAAYAFADPAAHYTVAGGLVTLIHDFSGAGAPDLAIQNAGTAAVDPITRTLALNNSWYTTPVVPRFNLSAFKSFFVACATGDPSGTHAAFLYTDSGTLLPSIAGVRNGIQVSANVDAIGDRVGSLIDHENSPRVNYPDFSVAAFSMGANARTRLRAGGFTSTQTPLSAGFCAVDSAFSIAAVGNSNRLSQYTIAIALGGEWNAEQAILFDRWARAHTPLVPLVLGTNPQQLFGLTAWSAGAKRFISYEGDSITAGVGTSGNQHRFDYLIWLLQGGNASGWAWVDDGINGQTILGASAAKLPTLAMNPHNADNLCVLWLGTNSLNVNLDPVTDMADLVTFGKYLWDQGYKVIVVNCLPAIPSIRVPGWDAARLVFNTLLAQEWPSFAFAFVDMAAVPALSNPADATNYADGLHPNDAGNIVIRDVLKPVIDQVALVPWRRRV